MLRFLTAFLLLTCPAIGQQIKLPEKIEGAQSAFIMVSAETTGEIVRWKSLDAGLNVFPAELLKNTKSTVVTSAKDGRYRLIAWTAIDGVPTEAAEVTIVIGKDPGPNPDPGPGPNPDPDPKPGGPYWIIILEETGQRTADTGVILADKAFWKSVTADGSELRVYDDDEPKAAPFVAITDARPALIVTTKNGTVVAVKPLPKTTAEIKEILK